MNYKAIGDETNHNVHKPCRRNQCEFQWDIKVVA